MLDAEIAKAQSDAWQVQDAIKKDEDVIAKLGNRLVNKEISDQTYNDLKNKYLRKISGSKSNVSNLESNAARLKVSVHLSRKRENIMCRLEMVV